MKTGYIFSKKKKKDVESKIGLHCLDQHSHMEPFANKARQAAKQPTEEIYF